MPAAQATTRRVTVVQGEPLPDLWAPKGVRSESFRKPEILFLSDSYSFGLSCLAGVLERQDLAFMDMVSKTPIRDSKISSGLIPTTPQSGLVGVPFGVMGMDLGIAANILDDVSVSPGQVDALERLHASRTEGKIIAHTAYSENIFESFDTIALSRKICPDADNVIGGPGVTIDGEGVLKDSKADFAVEGEGEKSFAQLVEVLGTFPRDERNSREYYKALNAIPGLYYRKDGRVVYSGKKNMPLTVSEMETLPVNYRLMMNIIEEGVIPMNTSRGCPYSCIICQSLFGKKYRPWSAERIMRDLGTIAEAMGERDAVKFMQRFRKGEGEEPSAIEKIFKRMGKRRFPKVKYIQFTDDDFLMDRERGLEFFRLYTDSSLKFKLSLQTSIPSLTSIGQADEELVAAAARANVNNLKIGPDCYSDSRLARIKQNSPGNPVTVKNIKDVVKLLAKYNIETNLYWILSDIDMTPEELREEVRNMREIASLHPKISIGLNLSIAPIEGTPAHKDRMARGLEDHIRYVEQQIGPDNSIKVVVGEKPINPVVRRVMEEVGETREGSSILDNPREIRKFCDQVERMLDRAERND